jgi:hypothetical protein
LTKDALLKICEIIGRLNYTIGKKSKIIDEIRSSNSSIKNKMKYKLNKKEFENILKLCNFSKKDKKGKNDYIKKHYHEIFSSRLNFFVSFLTFTDNHYSFTDIHEDVACRKFFYQKIISVIIKLEIMSINEIFINELTSLIKILINVIKKSTYNYFIDFENIFNYLNLKIHKISTISSEEISIKCFKLIYSISIFIITQIKKIFRIPSSIQKLHDEIIQEISNINRNYYNHLKDIDIYDYKTNSINNNVDKFYQKLIDEFADMEDDDNDLILSNKDFKILIELIHIKLFGKNSPLVVYFKSQGNQLDDYENEYPNKSEDKIEGDKGEETNLFDNLNNMEENDDDLDNMIIEEERNANDTIMITVNESNSNIMDLSLRTKNNNSDDEDEDDESESVSKFSDTFSQNINMPENEEDAISNSRFLTESKKGFILNSFRDDNSTTNFKV